MTDTAIATRDDRPPIVVLRDRLETRKGELRKMLTDIPPENFIRAVITSASPSITACLRALECCCSAYAMPAIFLLSTLSTRIFRKRITECQKALREAQGP